MIPATVRTDANLSGLIWTLVRTDFKARYHGTFGGYLWALLKPIAMFVVLLQVFSLIFSMDPNYALNLVIGISYWDFFADGTRNGMGSLQSKGFLITRAKFPPWIVILTSASNPLITLCLFALAISVYTSFVHHALAPAEVGLLLSYLLLYLTVIIGFSLGASVLFLRYRDLNQIWDLALQAGFFLAPVVYPLGIIPERYHFYLHIWPPTPVIQFTRSILVQAALPTATGHLMLLGTSLVILVLGVIIYRRLAPRAVEEL